MCAAVPDLPENEEYKRTFSVLFRNPIHAAELLRQGELSRERALSRKPELSRHPGETP